MPTEKEYNMAAISKMVATRPIGLRAVPQRYHSDIRPNRIRTRKLRASIPCPHYERTFRARIGISSN